MPNIIVKHPAGVLNKALKAEIAQRLTKAASDAEQIGDDPRQQIVTWVVFEEWQSDSVFAGGRDPLAQFVPFLVIVYTPSGVLDAGSQATFGKLLHAGISESFNKEDDRTVATSTIFSPVPNGTWVASGQIWSLPDITRAAGFKHLQHLVSE